LIPVAASLAFGVQSIQAVWNDLKYAVRGLRQKPGFAFLVVATLTAGMAGAACLFSFINAWMLEPLPYPQPDQLSFARSLDTREGRQLGLSAADFRDIKERARSFESLALWAPTGFTVSREGVPERVSGGRASAEFFEVLGVQPARGRAFRKDEESFGRQYVAVVTEGFWKSRLGGDPAAIGQKIRLNGEMHEVVGILPADFHFALAGRANVWTPAALADAEALRRGDRYWSLIGRRAPGVTQEQAARELGEIAAQLGREYPETNRYIGSFSLTLAQEVGEHTGNRVLFAVFLITVGLLLIACSNTANLLLVRAATRRRQAAIQLSLGASRRRLIRQGLIETMALFFSAAMIAGFAGVWLTDWIASMVPYESRGYLPNYGVVALHWRVFAFMAGAAFLTALTFGVAPALEAARTDVAVALKDLGSSSSGTRRRGRLRAALVIAQIALGTALLASTALLVQAFRSNWNAPTGFDPNGVLTFQMALDEKRYTTPEAIRAFYDRAADAVRQTAGSTKVAVAWNIPFGGQETRTALRIAGREVPERGKESLAVLNAIAPEYFAALGIPVKQGRGFQASDGPEAPLVAVVNEAFTRRHFPGQQAVGQRITLLRRRIPVTVEIVGVTADVRIDFDRQRPDPEVLVPFAQLPDASVFVMLRTPGDPSALLPAIREAVAKIDPEQPIFRAKTMDEWVEERFAALWIVGGLAAGFGLLALVMAAVGVYGVVAFSVSQRTKEFGIRAALGADRARLLRLVASQGVFLMLTGFLPGIALAVAAAIGLRSAMQGIAELPGAAPTIAGAVVVLAAAAFAATLIPARRAAAVDPVRAIRYE
jgi:putative ABC transport system permease protein